MEVLDGIFWVIGALFLIAILVIAVEGYKSIRQKRQFDYIATLKSYVDILVKNAEQLAKFNNMTGAEKKMLVMNGLMEIFPNAPDWLLDTLVEAAVLGLDKISSELEDIVVGKIEGGDG